MGHVGWASKMLNKLGVSPVEVLKYRYDITSDKALVEEIADILGVEMNPVKQIVELPDTPRKCYVWQVDGTDAQVNELTRQLHTNFIKKYNRDPQALHFIRNDIVDIEELDPEVVRERVRPWLEQEQE